MLGHMRARGTVFCEMVFALTIHALPAARVYAVLVLSALPAEMALLLADKTHGEVETVACARFWAHPD
jgi:hypothetical protein